MISNEIFSNKKKKLNRSKIKDLKLLFIIIFFTYMYFLLIYEKIYLIIFILKSECNIPFNSETIK